MKLSYQIIGSGQPLIILHGLFGSSDNWRGLAKQLSQYAQVITVDLRNHGRSPHSTRQNYQLMADDLVELLDELMLKKVDIIGHSIGGKMAMVFSQYHPERINKLLVVDIAPRAYADEHSTIFKALLSVELSRYKKRSEVDAVLSSSILEKTVRQFLLMNLDTLNDQLVWRINVQALFDNYHHLMAPVCQNQQITISSCFIRGGRSPYIKSEDEILIKTVFLNSQIVTIDQAGHWVHAEQPQQFLQRTITFFNYD